MRKLPNLPRLLPTIFIITCFSILTLPWLPISYLQASAQATAVITIDPQINYQTINGWEATAEIGQGVFLQEFLTWQNAVLDQAAELGINRLRVEVKSGAENPIDYFQQYLDGQITLSQFNQHRYEIINDNADPNSVNSSGFQFTELDFKIDNIVLPLKQRLQAAGETLFINVNYVDFGGSSFEHKANAAEYAEFVLATYQHLQTKYGWVPDAWEVVLEPDTSSASWSAQQVASCLVAAGNRLQSAGFTPAFVAPSTTNMTNTVSYFDVIAATSGALGYLKEISYHRYDGVSDAALQAIASRAVANNLNTAMLEWIGADYLTLHKDLTIGRNSAWQQFTLAYPAMADIGGTYFVIDRSIPSSPVVNIGSRTKFLRQYFKFIRRGAIRTGATTSNNNFDPLSFRNTNGKYAVVVKANTSGSFTLQGLPAGTYGIKYTTTSQYNVDLADATVTSGGTLTTSIPASGVLTVYDKSPQIPNCSYSISTPSQTFAASGGMGGVSVTATPGCAWTAVSNNTTWLTVTSGASGTGNGMVNYTVAANTVGSSRNGTITIAGQTFTVYQGATFGDVPPSHPFYTEIGKLSARGVTTGCGGGNFCPDAVVTREQMAAFIMRARGEFTPPTPASQRFLDVPPSNPFYNFIDRMAVLQITLGCGGGNYCPTSSVTREQMAAFLIRALHNPGYIPPAPASQRFNDVPPSSPFYAHIEEMAVRAITLGCSASPPLYCPANTVTRGQMAAFLVRAFNL